MQVSRWTDDTFAVCGFKTKSRKDREVMGGSPSGVLLMIWSLAGQAICFKRRDDVLLIGLVKRKR